MRRRILRWVLLAVAAPILGVAGFFFYRGVLITNFDCVVPGKVYRSAQPSPAQLKRWIDEYGLKTVINLRHDAPKTGLAEETAAAEAAGATIINIRLSSTKLPEPADLVRLADVLETAPQPLLLHCKFGADRSGVASVMARMAVGGKSYARSREQLDIRFLHVDSNPAHIEGVLLRYEQWCRDHHEDTGGWTEFRRWLAEDYRATP